MASFVPEDFDAFWLEVAHEARHVPLNFRRRRAPEWDLETHRIDRVAFQGALGLSLEGWIAYPEGAMRLPAFLWVPPYGRESLLPNAYGTREGFVSLSLNLHGLPAFHQEGYTPARGYFADGVGSPQTWVFRTLIQHAIVAARVLQAQPEADEERIGAMGFSQGGGMAIWIGACSTVVRAVCADMPFLGSTPYTFAKPILSYPLKELQDFMDREPLGRERVLHTLSYFDSTNVATRCAKPTLVSLGLNDAACRPDTVRAIHAEIPGETDLIEYPGGHDWHFGMVEANRAWLVRHLS